MFARKVAARLKPDSLAEFTNSSSVKYFPGCESKKSSWI